MQANRVDLKCVCYLKRTPECEAVAKDAAILHTYTTLTSAIQSQQKHIFFVHFMANKANEQTTTDIIFVALSVPVVLILENINLDNLYMQIHICTTQISSSVRVMRVDKRVHTQPA